MRRAAIVAPVRSAVGVYGGNLRPVPVGKLIAHVIKALIERSGLDAARLDNAERIEAAQGPLRTGDHVRGQRPGRGGYFRTRMKNILNP